MCGLVAMFSYGNGFFKPDVEAMQSMMLMNSIRGAHSTGMFGVNVNQMIDRIKVVGGPSHLFEHEQGERFFYRMFHAHRFTVGHGRYATQGAIDIKNAHPFHEENIHLVHNGTLTNFPALKKRFNLNHVDVDSRLCAILLNKLTPEELVREISGAYAFIWYDVRVNSMFVMRNSERPLYIFDCPKGEKYYISSEVSTFQYLKQKYSLEGEIKSFVVDKFYQFQFGKREIKEGDTRPAWKSKTSTASGGTTEVVPFQKKGAAHSPVRTVQHIPGSDIKVGLWIPMWPMDIKVVGEDRFAFKGLTVDDTYADVLCFTDVPPPEPDNDGYLYGIVTSISLSKQREVKTNQDVSVYRIHVTDLTNVRPDKLDVLQDLVTLYNGETLPIEEAKTLAAKGCAGCRKSMSINSLNFSSIQDGELFCLQCTTHYGAANGTVH